MNFHKPLTPRVSHCHEEEKSIIVYHRSYRKLQGSFCLFLTHCLICVIPLSLLILFFYPQVTMYMCRIAKTILAPYFLEDTLRIIDVKYIDAIGNVSFLYLPGKFPTVVSSMWNALVCLGLLVLLPYINRARPVIVFFIMILIVHLISSLFFLFLPSLFPYDAGDYSQLYMLQQIGIWFFIPIIMGISVILLPSSLISKSIVLVITYIYSILFGVIRYIVFVFIISKISLLYMAILFFAFGPLIDFVYVVGIYSMYVARLSKKLKGDFTQWHW